MKQKILKFLPLIIAAVLCITVSVVLLVTCGKGNDVSEIYVLSGNTPKLSYVEGQELDLTGGILTVVIDGEAQKVPLTSEGITVTGYDKNKTGNQEITVSYADLTTKFTVNVIPRVLIEGYETNYFVGDVFNKDAGKIKIANDTANGYTTINMNDSRVSVASFNSSTAGTSTVTVNCNVNGVVYPCSFNVTIYEHSNVTFVPPGITTYYSHDTSGLNVAKGNFTVTSSDSKLTKNVKLSADMVSGFDLSVATFENRNKPITQTLTVTYLDKTFTYDITIIYSEVSAIEHLASSVLNGIDWTVNSDPSLVMTEAQTEAALDAINSYYKLDKVDKQLLSENTRKVIARAGAVAVNTLFLEEFETYSETIKLKTEPSLQLLLTANDFEKVVLDEARLSSPDCELVKLAALLRKIEGDFPSVNVTDDKSVSDYIIIYSEDVENATIEVVSHLVNVYKPLKDIPENWTIDDLKAYGDGIVSSAVKMGNATYYREGTGYYYTSVVSKWREKNDFFEIIYSYLLYVHEDGASLISSTLIGKAPLISAVEEWYSVLQSLVNTEFKFKDNINGAYNLADISTLMYYYFLTLEKADEVKNNGTQLEKDLYKAIDGDLRIRVNAYTHDYGYLYHARGLVDCEAYVNLWESYYQVLKLYNKNALSATEHKDMIVEMYDHFQSFTPTELYSFLCSLNNLYERIDHSKNTELLYVLKFADERAEHFNHFAIILNEYFSTYLSAASQPIFEKLLLAMESYALLEYRSTALDEFLGHMAEITAAYGNLSNEEKAEFDALVGTGYQRYLAIYNRAISENTYSPEGANAELIAKLEAAIMRFYTVYDYMTTLNSVPDGFFGMLYSFYADAMRSYEAIVTSGNTDLISYLFEQEYQIGENRIWTLDFAYADMDGFVTYSLIKNEAGLTATDGSIIRVTDWDLFADYGVFDIIADMSDLLYYEFLAGEMELSNAYVAKVMSDLWALTDFQRSLVTHLHLDGPYYAAILTYFKANLSDEGDAFADKLIDAELCALDLDDESNKAAFMLTMEELAAEYAELSDSDKAVLDAMYNKYLELYNELSA